MTVVLYIGTFLAGYYLGQVRGIILGSRDQQTVAYRMGYWDAENGRPENPDYNPLKKKV